MTIGDRVRIVDTYTHPRSGRTIDLVGMSAYVLAVDGDYLVVQPASWGLGQIVLVAASAVVPEPMAALVTS